MQKAGTFVMTQATPEGTMAAAPGPKGLGGLLILPMIGLVVSPVVVVITIWGFVREATSGPDGLTTSTLSALFQLGWQDWLTFFVKDPSSAFGLIVGLLAFLLLLVLFFLSLACLVLMFRKSSVFPVMMIVLYAINALLLVATSAIFAADLIELTAAEKAITYRDTLRSVLQAAVWIPYFVVSKRVKNTFVH